MSLRLRMMAVLLLGGGLACFAGPMARSEELSEETRKQVEYAFLDGRFHALEGLLEGRSPLDHPGVLADFWWRKSPSLSADELERDVAIERLRVVPDLAWALAGRTEPPYPAHGGGGEDPYPLLRALIQDRIQRERSGWAGYPDASPLAAYLKTPRAAASEDETYYLQFTLAMMTRSYVGDEDPAYVAQADAEARKHHDRNRLIYLTSLGMMLVLSFIASVVVVRRRDGEPDA